nr:hypothetical protein [Neobacillus sp. Marseille-Q6967]
MELTIEKLQKLHQSVQKLEAVLQEVWSHVDGLEEDEQFKKLAQQVKQNQKNKSVSSVEELGQILNEFDNCLEEIPEDGTAAIDFEDAISEIIEWIKVNK